MKKVTSYCRFAPQHCLGESEPTGIYLCTWGSNYRYFTCMHRYSMHYYDCSFSTRYQVPCSSMYLRLAHLLFEPFSVSTHSQWIISCLPDEIGQLLMNDITFLK